MVAVYHWVRTSPVTMSLSPSFLRSDINFLQIYIHSTGSGVPNRLKIRSPSFCNLSICSKLLPGHRVSDIPAILGSLDFEKGECDR